MACPGREDGSRGSKTHPPPAPLLLLCLALLPAAPLPAQVPVEELLLENGMRFLVVPRPGAPLVAAGWAVHAGSAAEEPGRTGLAHLLEHLMFQGTRTIGTRDIDRELPLMAERQALEQRLRAADDPELAAELGRRATELDRRLRSLRRKGEYALVYTGAGAQGINAMTREDFTAYYMLIPPGKLEVWFWMESDRLLAPVFRDFYAEFGVIEEERRQRIDATPAGALRQEFDARFWGAGHPYSWPAAGRSEDVRSLDPEDARRFFDSHYAPSRLTAALIGDVDPGEIRELAERYFGRLPPREPAGGKPEPDAPDPSSPPPGPLRWEASCACPSQIEVRYRTVPFEHPDADALDLLAGVLNGRTGRLHRRLVLERSLAFSAWSRHSALARDGSFSLHAEVRGDAPLERLEEALLAEVSRLRSETVSAPEMEKVRNQVATDAWRQVREPLPMLLRLLIFDALGSWRDLNRKPRAARRLEPEELRRVAQRHLVPERRGIAVLRRAGDT